MNASPVSTTRRADARAVAFALLLPSLVTWLYYIQLAQSAAALQQTAYAVGKALQFAFPLFWVLKVQRGSLRWTAPHARGLAPGTAFGLLVSAAILVGYHLWLKPAGYLAGAGEAIYRKVAAFGVTGFWSYLALGAFYCVVHSLLEEYYWRWFAFGQLRRLLPASPAIWVSAIGFMAHHVIILGALFGWGAPPAVLFSAAVAVGGAVWAWIYHRSGSLYAVWVSHLVVDAAIFTVGYDLARPWLSS